ncbi:MAG: hypothetical protein HC786_09315 [Richelia sp. CSU_2_1]|nr:hypothetical protein [Richelia sp. CSU_2_1]
MNAVAIDCLLLASAYDFVKTTSTWSREGSAVSLYQRPFFVENDSTGLAV